MTGSFAALLLQPNPLRGFLDSALGLKKGITMHPTASGHG
jgi:hypothetical protein